MLQWGVQLRRGLRDGKLCREGVPKKIALATVRVLTACADATMPTLEARARLAPHVLERPLAQDMETAFRDGAIVLMVSAGRTALLHFARTSAAVTVNAASLAALVSQDMLGKTAD